MDLFWYRNHDQRLHVYVVERVAKSAYYGTKQYMYHKDAKLIDALVCYMLGKQEARCIN